MDASSGSNQGPGGREEDGSLAGLPRNIKGFAPSHFAPAEKVARDYMTKAGLPYGPPATYVKANPARGKRIAAAYEAMPHDPQNPEVKAAYAAMIKEVEAQYEAILATGLEVEFIDFEKTGDPYALSPRMATDDVRDNNHFWVFSTRDGYGTAEVDVEDNPMLAETKHTISGQRALANDLFRVVHDYFGHVKEGLGFRADGEENAWRAHVSMFSPLAARAVTSETRGQNSWVNFGPMGEKNRTANGADTHYADQKVGLLPQWVTDEAAGDAKLSPARAEQALQDTGLDITSQSAWTTDGDILTRPVTVREGNKEVELTAWFSALPDSTRYVLQIEDEDGLDYKGKSGYIGDNVGDALLSTSRPMFYSQLEKAFESVPDRLATMAAPQWKLWLDANAAKLGVKKDEVEWSGVRRMLDVSGIDKVSREDISSYLRKNAVRTEAIGRYVQGETLAEVAQALGFGPTRIQSFVTWAGVNRSAQETRGVTPEKQLEAVRLYRSGESLAKIQAKIGLSQGTLHRIVTAAGASRSLKESRALGEEIKSDVVGMYLLGLNNREVAQSLGLGESTVNRIVQAEGVARGYSGAQILRSSIGRASYSRGIQGQFASSKGGGTMYTASIYEMARMHQLEQDELVASFKRSEDRIPYGSGKTYNPDLEVVYVDGRSRVEEIKPFYMLNDPKVQLKAKVGLAHYGALGRSFAVVTEKSIGPAGFEALSPADFPGKDPVRIKDALRSARWAAGELATAVPPDIGVPVFSPARDSDSNQPSTLAGRSKTAINNVATQTDTPEFKKWFGDSKVVDASGRPMVVYHGTADRFTEFSKSHIGDPNLEGGFYFTPERQIAEDFGDIVMPVYLNIKNPKVFTAAQWGETGDTAAQLQAQGYDGMRVQDYDMSGGEDEASSTEDMWVAFEPTQVKSAKNNSGNFDGKNKDITQSSARNGDGTWQMPATSRFDDAVYKMQNKMIDVKRVIESIGKVADNLNVYLQEELFHGRAAKQTTDFADGELKPLMEKMARTGLTMEALEEYLHAKHAPEANRVIAERNPDTPGLQDGGSGMTNAAAAAILQALPARERAALADAAIDVRKILDKTRQLYADYGLEPQGKVDGWAGMFDNYIPLQREQPDGTGSGMGMGQGFSVKGKEVKGRTGSTRKVVDVLGNIAMQRERLIVRGEKNRVAVALVGLAQANPNADFWSVGAPPSERVYDPKTNTVVDRQDPMFKSRENVLVAKIRNEDGSVTETAVVFKEDEPRAARMAAALKNLDAGNLEGLLGISAKITRYFAAINTQYNPVFGVVNLIRDVQGAMVNLGGTPLAGSRLKIARNTLSAIRGIYSDMRSGNNGSEWSELWEQFQNEGGQTGYRDLFRTGKDRANELKKTLNPDGWMDSPMGKLFTANGALKAPMSAATKGSDWLFGWLSDYNEAMENGVRLAAFKAGLDQGMSVQKAASLAKNLTVNFNRKGQVGQQAGAVYAFFNAAMQGSARIGQALFDMEGGDLKTLRMSKTGKQVIYGGLVLGSMQALALAAAGFDDEDPPDFVRERSLVIPTGGKTYVSIPMPLGLHVIPGLGRQATEFALSGFKDPAKRVISMTGMFVEAFNPIGSAGWSMQTLAPTALDPLVALTENRDWTGKPIARESRNPATPGHTLAKDTATGFSKMLSEAINAASGGNQYVAGALSPTPDQIDYLLAQVGGGVARELSKIEQTAFGVARGEAVPTFKIPLAGRFIGNAGSQSSEGTAFYANISKANAVETEIKGMQKDGKRAEAQQLRQDRPEAYLIAQANAAERQVQKLRKEKRTMVEKGADREAVKAMEERITAVMARLNRSADQMREKQAAK